MNISKAGKQPEKHIVSLELEGKLESAEKLNELFPLVFTAVQTMLEILSHLSTIRNKDGKLF